ncbi:site-2 protease family protein [Patescibacteria group bacterium]|nr:site-2 protease family protein [Patescibacteria group bacterium]
MNDVLILVFQFIVFIFSVMVHEVSHGLMAYHLGDDTAKNMNRLNLNPLNHIDPVGSIILPGLLFLMQSPILFGWAKPVPYNPYNLKEPKKGAALIGAAGPLSNLGLALVFGLCIRALNFVPATAAVGTLAMFFGMIVYINIILAIFNLIPVSPLDGSKLLFAVLPDRYGNLQRFLEQYGLLILFFFIFFGLGFLQPIVNGLYLLFAGH